MFAFYTDRSGLSGLPRQVVTPSTPCPCSPAVTIRQPRADKQSAASCGTFLAPFPSSLHRDGLALGSLCRSHIRDGCDRRGPSRCQCRHEPAAARLCAGIGAIAGLALLVEGRLLKAIEDSLGVGEWVRGALGAVVMIAVAAIVMGRDTGFLARASLGGTNLIEQGSPDRVLGPRSLPDICCKRSSPIRRSRRRCTKRSSQPSAGRSIPSQPMMIMVQPSRRPSISRSNRSGSWRPIASSNMPPGIDMAKGINHRSVESRKII